MFFVICKRTTKQNALGYTVSGPFAKGNVAERAAITALSTYSCLAAQVLTLDRMKAIRAESWKYETSLWNAISEALKTHGVLLAVESPVEAVG